eukprot:1414030-Prymnesium_polylepis.1
MSGSSLARGSGRAYGLWDHRAPSTCVLTITSVARFAMEEPTGLGWRFSSASAAPLLIVYSWSSRTRSATTTLTSRRSRAPTF